MSFWKKLIGTSKSKRTDNQPKKPDPLPEIHRAARDGDVEKIKALLKENPDLAFSKDDSNYTPLIWAAIYGKTDAAELLLSNKTIANAENYKMDMALCLAKSRDVVKLLMANGAKVDLSSAAVSGLNDVAELLIADKADVNAKSGNGWTPLHFASYYSHIEIVKMLLANGADVHAKSDDSQTPLHAAATYSNRDMVELLLAHHTEINVQDKLGRTPLHLAVVEREKDVVESLLVNGADTNVKDNLGKTPLQWAIIKDEKDIVELLRRHGARDSVKPDPITRTTLPPELVEAAKVLEQQLQDRGVKTCRIALDDWSEVPQEIHDVIPKWIPTLLADFSLFGSVLELRNFDHQTWPRYFSFWGPVQYAGNLFGKHRYCFTDEFMEEGLVMISDESDGNMWLVSISGGPASPIYLFDQSGHEKIVFSNRIDLLMKSMVISED